MFASSIPPGLSLECAPGTVIAAKYVLERPAGFGGMSQLWVATNKATGAEVCVKLLLPTSDKESDEEAVQRFRREAHAAARLNHRAIVRVFDLLELDDKGDAVTTSVTASSKAKTPYAYAIVMELLKGETLGDVLAKRGKIPLDEALDLFLPVISALSHAHRASVIHRDIKPDNIFLAQDPDGLVIPKVLDFGVSKLPFADAITIDGVLVGTPSFMSPEQAKGARLVDARSDVFSAGILLYMMLSGTNPFAHEEGSSALSSSSSSSSSSFSSAVEAILRREVPRIDDISPEIWAVLKQALEKDPAARFGDATEMSIALRKACGRKSTTESNPMIMQVEPVSQRTLARALDRPSWSDPNPLSASPPPKSTTKRTTHANETVPPADPDSSRPITTTTSHADKQRRNRTFVFSILGSAAVIVVVSFVVKAVHTTSSAPPPPPPPTFAITAPPVAATTEPTATASASASAQPVAEVKQPPAAPSSKPKRSPSTSTTTTTSTRKPYEPHIARDPGF